MPGFKHVALLIDTSRAYGRGLIRGVAQYNRKHGEWLLCFQPHGLDDLPTSWLKHWQGDGIMARIRDRRMAQAVLRPGLPVVQLRGIATDLGLPLIGVDNRAVSRMVTQHLCERGFRHFGFCGLPRGQHRFMDQRGDHFREMIEDAGYECHVFPAKRRRGRDDAWEHEQDQLGRWIASLPKPVGLMACNDERGLPLLDACRRVGVLVPDEVAVIGVDNDEYLCEMSIPPLSSVDVNPERIGYEAAALLDRMMAGDETPPEYTTVPPRAVVTRQSTDVLATDDREVARAVAFIRQHACDPIQVSDVLWHVSLSRAGLEPRFKRGLGRTIYQEIQRVRVEQAKELLSLTDLPLKQIARRTGFKYPQYLARVFRQATGQPPAQYRRQTQPGLFHLR